MEFVKYFIDATLIFIECLHDAAHVICVTPETSRIAAAHVMCCSVGSYDVAQCNAALTFIPFPFSGSIGTTGVVVPYVQLSRFGLSGVCTV
jgi:hypothetical protein